MATTTGMTIITVVVTAIILHSHSVLLTLIPDVVSIMMHWVLCVLEAAVGPRALMVT